ncbi:D-alanyl-D-alanine carboxypeptidase/D-alanyl-D-alanine endopeptidase [Actinosynnema sp. ALI-1.44]|uniref:D-alanyl-D-alanine carboxypeptidase/D-alanyl-D-alanine endopeptidase n=1 Tax=Actinosynnema sp. ALI-1.44 TaxID=1933779 RepID=UPI001177CD5B|nr:D-alanyl-D-alanine carboxypeptidase/D-alanyl-D-alanine-endopeptidase [Actinosynnema sp. ALI-1.44]
MSVPSLFTPQPAEATARTEPVKPPEDEERGQPQPPAPDTDEPGKSATEGLDEPEEKSEPAPVEPAPAEPNPVEPAPVESATESLFTVAARDSAEAPQHQGADDSRDNGDDQRPSSSEESAAEATVRSGPVKASQSQRADWPEAEEPSGPRSPGENAAESTERGEPAQPSRAAESGRSDQVPAAAWPSSTAPSGAEPPGDGRFSTAARTEPVRPQEQGGGGEPEGSADGDGSAEATMRSLPVQPPPSRREVSGGSEKAAKEPEPDENSLFAPTRNEPTRPPQLPRGGAAMGLESSGEGVFDQSTRREPMRPRAGAPMGLETSGEGPFAAPTRSEPMRPPQRQEPGEGAFANPTRSEPMRPPQRPRAGAPMGLETSGEGPFAAPTRSEPMRPPGARPGAPQRPSGEPVRPPVDRGQSEATVRTEPVRPPAEETEPPFPLGFEDDPPEPPSDDDTPKGRRPRKGLFVLAALVLVIAVGAGVVFFVPGVREKLGLGGSDADTAVAPPPAPVAFTPSIKGADGGAPTPTKQGVQGVLAGPAGNAALGTLTGTVIDPATGDVLWDKASNTPLTPASTTKLLTAAAALLKLPHGQQFSTKVVAGPQPGSVIIVGGGDGTLNSLPAGKNSVFPGSPRLDDLVAQVKAKGPVSQVFVDRTRYTTDNLAPGVLPGDVAEGYISPITPLMMDGARQDPTKDKSPRSTNPPRTVAAEFAKRIGASVAASPEVKAPADAQVLGEVRSAPLTELVDQFLQASDNVLADVVAREVAIAAGEEPSFQGVHKATLKVLAENGFDVTGAELFDGSGMSTSNKTPSLLLAKVLATAAGDGKDEKSAKLRPMLGGLPVAGGSGTLEGRFAVGQAAAGGRGWVRAKTGTLPLAGINSLAGVVLDKDGRLLVFALMTNGSDTIQARPALDAVAAALRTCGCK